MTPKETVKCEDKLQVKRIIHLIFDIIYPSRYLLVKVNN